MKELLPQRDAQNERYEVNIEKEAEALRVAIDDNEIRNASESDKTLLLDALSQIENVKFNVSKDEVYRAGGLYTLVASEIVSRLGKIASDVETIKRIQQDYSTVFYHVTGDYWEEAVESAQNRD